MEAVAKALGLGKLLSAPVPVKGGLLHRMEKVTCESGVYALKTLNPQIMKRPEAMANMLLSERIATALKETVPLVHAIEQQGNYVHTLNGKHYMVYPWVEGRSIFFPEITKAHCARMGDILGRIHKANVHVSGAERGSAEEVQFDPGWICGLEKLFQVISDEIPLLEKWEREANQSKKALSACQVISHRDLDPKNVLWQGNEPLLIDWEAAGYVNPYQEMMETAVYWADDGRGSLKEAHFKAFVAAYEQHIPLHCVDWQAVFAACFQGTLGWLYYNIRRACGLEAADEGDRQTGREQVMVTIKVLKAMENKNALAYQWIKSL